MQNAVSVFCRLGFAHKRNADPNTSPLHVSWAQHALSAGGAVNAGSSPVASAHTTNAQHATILNDLITDLDLDALEPSDMTPTTTAAKDGLFEACR
jgi:hypothetical protein